MPGAEAEARQLALTALARRDHCSSELRAKLGERGFDAATVSTVLEALQQEGLQSDTRFAEHFVSYHAARGHGPLRIGRDLRGLKLDPELIGRFLDEGQDWTARAREVRRRKFREPLPKTYADKAKQARFLQYRGFTGDQIRAALGPMEDIDLDP